MMPSLLRAALLFGTVAAATASSPGARLSGESTLTAVVRQMNVPVEGRFTRFEGFVDFRPDDLAGSRAELKVDTTSFDLGMADFNAEVAKPEWLDSRNHPEARFAAQGLTALGEGRYRTEGTLELKGRSAPLAAELLLSEADGKRVFTGEVPLDRSAFAIGSRSWDGVVDRTVTVRFRLVQPLP